MKGLIIGAAAIIAIAAACSSAHASSPDAAPDPRVCVVFEDSSFICGHSDPDGGWIDRTRPYVVGCIPGPEAGCGSPDED